MKLSGKTVYGEYVWELLKGHTHKLRDVLNQLKKTRVDASDERVCLAMLLLVESILLPKNNKGTFPLEYVNKAKDMMYPWGRDAYLVLLSNWAPTVDVPGPIYLCEKNTELENPSLERVLQIEAHKNLKVTCILPPIPHDPEDDVSMEDEHSDELESVKDISKKGYKFKADDWKNRSVDTLDTLNALIHMTIHMTEHVETSQASASIEEDSENTKLNKIIELMMENAKRMKDQMSLLEAENMELRAPGESASAEGRLILTVIFSDSQLILRSSEEGHHCFRFTTGKLHVGLETLRRRLLILLSPPPHYLFLKLAHTVDQINHLMGSNGIFPPPHHMHRPGLPHPEAFGSVPSFPPQLMEQKLAAQHGEMQRLAIENQRLAATHGNLRQELAAAQHELQMLHSQIGSMKSEGEQRMSGLADKVAKIESELRKSFRTQKSRSDVQQVPALMSELDGLRQEYQQCR
ncbi:unnamed protein product [Brassica napus]|uniref:(rape) hypothetical protein n=1 Tax=Brassica napus TaxID=3708 RepID=A0A816K7R1_BRANA|nr:unnamed protein product [Brassica napus]